MPDAHSVLAAADEAATAGDLEGAERLLREALALQEAALGPDHPDLANTVNNLAVVCERLNKVADAERGYRRAHRIAVTSLSPGHPFVATSLKNLVEFCAAHGVPLWAPQGSGASAANVPGSSTTAPVPEPPSATATRRLTPRMAVTLAAIALAIVLLTVTQWRRGGDERAAPAGSDDTAVATTPDTSPPTASPAIQPPVAPAPPPVVPARQPSAAARVPARESPRPSATLTVLTARVCAGFSRTGSPDWECSPAGEAAQPGRFTFYTRVQSDAATTLEHRWLRDGRLHQSVKLKVPASGAQGYRTFSQTTVNAERAGNWKVELRAADGTVVGEDAFVVR